jgi:hypothetical protein
MLASRRKRSTRLREKARRHPRFPGRRAAEGSHSRARRTRMGSRCNGRPSTWARGGRCQHVARARRAGYHECPSVPPGSRGFPRRGAVPRVGVEHVRGARPCSRRYDRHFVTSRRPASSGGATFSPVSFTSIPNTAAICPRPTARSKAGSALTPLVRVGPFARKLGPRSSSPLSVMLTRKVGS